METPVFEERDPKTGYDCPGFVDRRHAVPSSSRAGRAGRLTARQAFALAAVTGTMLGVGQAMPAAAAAAHAPLRPGAPAGDQPPDTPQGTTAPLHSRGGPPVLASSLTTTRAAIISRAKKWVAAKVPYSMDDYWTDGYRQDCSGFVSMAWNLGTNEWTGSLDKFGVRITKGELQPGDILLFHNSDNSEKGSHVVMFGGWTDYSHQHYTAYEETPPAARRQATPYAYWSNSSRYVPYRYKNLTEGKSATQGKDLPLPATVDMPAPVTGFPGDGPAGRDSVASAGPSAWSMAQKKGEDRYAAETPGAVAGLRTASPEAAPDVPDAAPDFPDAAPDFPDAATDFPGPGMFRPGADNPHVARLGRQLVTKGFGKHYTGGPGPHWGETDRRNVEAFQRAQGWRGLEADGYPGPETWRRLFS
jgi:hypothetical protein